MKEIKSVNSTAKIIAIILFIIISTLAINIYSSFSDILYTEDVFKQIKNTLTYNSEIYVLDSHIQDKHTLLELNLKDLELEYKKYKTQNQIKIITNLLVLMISFISVATIQNLIYNLEKRQENLEYLEENIKQKLYRTLSDNHHKLSRKEALK